MSIYALGQVLLDNHLKQGNYYSVQTYLLSWERNVEIAGVVVLGGGDVADGGAQCW